MCMSRALRAIFPSLSRRSSALSRIMSHPYMSAVESKEEGLVDGVQKMDLSNNTSVKKDKKPAAPAADASAYPLEKDPVPEYIPHRIKMFDELKTKYDAMVAAQPQEPIKILLADGRIMDGTSWKTHPMDIAKMVDPSLPDRLVIAKVDGELWDCTRPLEKSCTLEFLDFECEEGKAVFWHSSAHVLGEACERHYGCHLCLGPPVEEGFYYEMDIADRTVSTTDYPLINKMADKIIKDKQKFERLVVSKDDLLEMFKHNPLKLRLISDKIPDGTSTTVYRCGPLIDLCRGPHITNTSRIKAFTVTKNSSSYFLGSAENQVLQRIYGISFPDKEQMKAWQKFKDEADQRDHRLVGRNQELFFFHELSPGSCFFLPHGARIYNRLLEFMRAEYRKRGFTEVITPNIFHENLWKTSGHWDHYRDDMFACGKGDEVFYLKPMNCPGHCLMFKHRERSYRELPIRFADFGVLHRNELTGALHGLTRVRRFQQDDAHIFCRVDQLESEMQNCLDFLQHVYGILGFSFHLRLSTRPEKYLGELAVWESAEASLAASLNAFGQPWEINPGDGAFYGPKIDITIMDAHKRKHQCATIQVDFQLPERFKLDYRAPPRAEDPSEASSALERPVIIHRAILGSIERCMAVLTESYGGNWPFWLSPRQAIVVPVSHANDAYAQEVEKRLHDAGFYVESDCGDATFNKRIRNAETNKHTFIVVVGNKEAEDGTVNVRKATADGKDLLLPLDLFITKLKSLEESKPLSNFIEA